MTLLLAVALSLTLRLRRYTPLSTGTRATRSPPKRYTLPASTVMPCELRTPGSACACGSSPFHTHRHSIMVLAGVFDVIFGHGGPRGLLVAGLESVSVLALLCVQLLCTPCFSACSVQPFARYERTAHRCSKNRPGSFYVLCFSTKSASPPWYCCRPCWPWASGGKEVQKEVRRSRHA
jgi:hypothetical protein